MSAPYNTEPKTHKFGQKWMSKSNNSSDSDDEINVKLPQKNSEYIGEVPKNIHKSKKQKKKEKGECFRCGLIGHFEEDCTSEPNINSGSRKNDPMGYLLVDRKLIILDATALFQNILDAYNKLI